MTRVENPQELQGMRRELETAVSAATVAEAQEEQAVNEAREADGRLAVAKMLGGAGEVGGWALEKDGNMEISEEIWTFLWKYGIFCGNMDISLEILQFLLRKYGNFLLEISLEMWEFVWRFDNFMDNVLEKDEVSVEFHM